MVTLVVFSKGLGGFGCLGATAVERIWHISDSQGLDFQVKVRKLG